MSPITVPIERILLAHPQHHAEPCFALHHPSVSISSLFKRKRLDHRTDILKDAPFTVSGSTTRYNRDIFRDGQFPYFGTYVGTPITIFGRVFTSSRRDRERAPCHP